MRANPLPLITALLLLPLSLLAQQNSRYDLLLKSGTLTTQPNISEENILRFNRGVSMVAGKNFVIIQFNQLPNEAQKKELRSQGIELLDYVPNNAFTASIT